MLSKYSFLLPLFIIHVATANLSFCKFQIPVYCAVHFVDSDDEDDKHGMFIASYEETIVKVAVVMQGIIVSK